MKIIQKSSNPHLSQSAPDGDPEYRYNKVESLYYQKLLVSKFILLFFKEIHIMINKYSLSLRLIFMCKFENYSNKRVNGLTFDTLEDLKFSSFMAIMAAPLILFSTEVAPLNCQACPQFL